MEGSTVRGTSKATVRRPPGLGERRMLTLARENSHRESGSFAAYCFFDVTGVQTEVLREIRDGIAGLISLVDG